MSVRLPSDIGYSPQVDKEQRWLPFLAPRLPLPVPVPLARGAPGEGYPFFWSVNRWIDGSPATVAPVDDWVAFATSLADFLVKLQGVDASIGPPAGAHSFFRGGPLETYDAETRHWIAQLDGLIPARVATEAWEAALAATWHGPPVWFHGDVAAGNLLVVDGRLAAVIDFGCMGVGDPACDLTIAWTLFLEDSREAFRAGVPLDAAAWARARGWALWKALITWQGLRETDAAEAARIRRVIDDVLAEFVALR
jgi:aminoglycoside phosphotransferase (APT) family kinase protein